MKNVIRLTCLAVSLLLCACQAKKEAQVVPVYTATTPLVEDIALPRSYVANIASLRNVEIRSQQAGVLQNVYASEGQYVKAGQPLFRIAIFGANEEVTKAKAAAEQARIDLQNVEKLAESKVVSNNAKRMAAAKLKGAEADYRLAVMRKRLSIIRAPFSGILGRIPNKQGSLIEENNLLVGQYEGAGLLQHFGNRLFGLPAPPGTLCPESLTIGIGQWRGIPGSRQDFRPRRPVRQFDGDNRHSRELRQSPFPIAQRGDGHSEAFRGEKAGYADSPRSGV